MTENTPDLEKLLEEYESETWKKIYPDFTSELIDKWKSLGFGYEECKR